MLATLLSTPLVLACPASLAIACRTPAPTRVAPSPPPPAADPATPRPAADASPVEPDACHPSVGWNDGAFEVVGLPCISRDGAEILFARSGEQPRSFELTVAGATRADRTSRIFLVVEPHERGELVDALGRPMPALHARLVKANVLLEEASRRAVPLAALAPTPAGTHAGRGLEVAWTERGRLTISRGGRFLHEGDYGGWLAPPAACAPHSYLEQVWGDPARGVLLVKIAYRGSAGCTAAPELHVIGWIP